MVPRLELHTLNPSNPWYRPGEIRVKVFIPLIYFFRTKPSPLEPFTL
jgi:hypothetical protein